MPSCLNSQSIRCACLCVSGSGASLLSPTRSVAHRCRPLGTVHPGATGRPAANPPPLLRTLVRIGRKHSTTAVCAHGLMAGGVDDLQVNLLFRQQAQRPVLPVFRSSESRIAVSSVPRRPSTSSVPGPRCLPCGPFSRPSKRQTFARAPQSEQCSDTPWRLAGLTNPGCPRRPRAADSALAVPTGYVR